MFKRTVLILLFVVTTKCDETNDIEVHQHFKKIGYLATGLSYAHIHAKIDFRKIKIAYDSVNHYVNERKTTTTSNEEKTLIDAIDPQLRIASKTIDDLKELFFGGNLDREKRQLFLGLAMAFGIINTGMSIFNTIEVTKLHGEISNLHNNMNTGFRHVVHILQEEDHAIHRINENIDTLKKTCRFVLERIENEDNQINTLTNIIGLLTMVSNLNAEISSWGRGLEALSHGQLHPTLIDPTRLKKGLQDTFQKAKTFGLKPLHEELSFVYKNPISFISTKKYEIIIIVHIPLVDQDPLELYKYIPIPVRIENLFVTIEDKFDTLAVDSRGQLGLQMSEFDLLNCHNEETHNGKVFICPNSNLVQNQIRKTCLGSLFYAHKKEMLATCQYFTQSSEDQQEFAKQISSDSIIFYTRDYLTIFENCPQEKRVLHNITGLSTLTIQPGCKLLTEEYTFNSPININFESGFIRKTMKIPILHMTNGSRPEDLEQVLQDLKNIKKPNRVHLQELNNWMQTRNENKIEKNIHFSVSITTIILGLLVVCAFGYIYHRYKTSKTQKENSSQ
jgi:hypothetical protein